MLTEDQAIEILNSGGVVAIPTETVYGLAARIDSEVGLKKIFKIKERPFFDPLIVHVHSALQAKNYCKTWPQVAQFLTDKFWPGPLTLVLPKDDKVLPVITSGLDTVGLRCPNHSITLSLLNKIKVPLAAPSANKFTKTSPTCAQHVLDSLPEVDVLDGGDCEVGIESTIIAIEQNGKTTVKLLRPGMIQWSEIQKSLKEFDIDFINEKNDIKAPGSMEDHYMPNTPLILVRDKFKAQNLEDLLMAQFHREFKKPFYLDLPRENYLAARVLYSKLREADKTASDYIVLFVETHMLSEEWLPLWDRLQKASSFKI